MQSQHPGPWAWARRNAAALYWLCFAALLLALGFFCFFKLGGYMLNPWDESTHGTSAYEMTQTGELLVTTIDYQVDYFNTKPPLSIWIIAACYKLFGYNAFALRFYSALSMLLIGLLSALWLRRRVGALASLASLAFFMACEPFFNYHMARHGDADALYNLLFLVAMLAMLELDRHPRLLYLCGLAFALAFLAKSWHAAMIAVIGFLYLLLTGLIRRYRPGQLALFAGCALGPELLWAVLRYRRDGWEFLGRMFFFDIQSRLSETTTRETLWDYFTDYARYPEFKGYLILALAALLLALAAWRRGLLSQEQKHLVLGLGLWAVLPFTAFTLASAKKIWYVFPSVVALVLLAACGAGLLLGLVKSPRSAGWLLVLALAAPFLLVGAKESLKVVLRAENGNQQQLFLQQALSREDDAFRKQRLYQKDGDVPDWREPSDELAAELYGDMIPTNGGIDGFLADPGSYLVLDEATYAETPALLEAQVCAQGHGYLLLYHAA